MPALSFILPTVIYWIIVSWLGYRNGKLKAALLQARFLLRASNAVHEQHSDADSRGVWYQIADYFNPQILGGYGDVVKEDSPCTPPTKLV